MSRDVPTSWETKENKKKELRKKPGGEENMELKHKVFAPFRSFRAFSVILISLKVLPDIWAGADATPCKKTAKTGWNRPSTGYCSV
jgi:hypothetical protein